jgi:ArsR family transcriptional regulator
MDLNMIPDPVLEKQFLDPQAQVFKLLAHPARLAILEILREGEACVCHMEAFLGHRQAYLSQQLAVLREAGMIQDRRDGWNIFYCVARPEVFTILDAVAALTGPLAPSRAPRKEAVPCPCPKCVEKRGKMHA